MLRRAEGPSRSTHPFVMPGLDPGIHSVSFERVEAPMEWIAGSSPAMTVRVRSAERRVSKHDPSPLPLRERAFRPAREARRVAGRVRG
jgi:hypothetical protein